MFRNTLLLFITAIILFFLFLSSCNETSILENKTANSNETSLLKETKTKVKIIGYEIIKENGKEKKVPIYDGDPTGGEGGKVLSCDYYSMYTNRLDRYEPKSGKI